MRERRTTPNSCGRRRFRAGDRLASWTGGAYTHNAAGCVTHIERDGRPTLDLTWNGQYQLVSVSTNGVFAEAYAYDALGRRVSTTTQEGTVRHVYDDNWQCLADIDETGNVRANGRTQADGSMSYRETSSAKASQSPIFTHPV